MGHLVVSRKRGQGVFIGDAHVEVKSCNSGRVVLKFTAADSIAIVRDELKDRQIPKSEGDVA